MRNVWRQLKGVMPDPPLQVGTVGAVDGERIRIDLPGGGSLHARSPVSVAVGGRVFVRDGVVEGTAPDLPIVEVEV